MKSDAKEIPDDHDCDSRMTVGYYFCRGKNSGLVCVQSVNFLGGDWGRSVCHDHLGHRVVCCVVDHCVGGGNYLKGAGQMDKRGPGVQDDCNSLKKGFGHVDDYLGNYNVSGSPMDQIWLLGLRGILCFYGQVYDM